MTCCLHSATRFSSHSNGCTRPISYMEITVLFSNMMSNRWIHFHFHLSQCPGSKTIKVNQNSSFITTSTLTHSASSSWLVHKTITKHHHSTLSRALACASLLVRLLSSSSFITVLCQVVFGWPLFCTLVLTSLYAVSTVWMPGTGYWALLGRDQTIAACGYYNQQLLNSLKKRFPSRVLLGWLMQAKM